MREAIGGTLLMYIIIFFLFIYIAFMAIVINYGRVFRVKNALVSYIETNEGYDENAKDGLTKTARSMGYVGSVRGCYEITNNNNYYYSIKLSVSFQLPLLKNAIDIPITGQTSAVRKVKGKNQVNGIEKCGAGDNKFTTEIVRERN